MSTSVKHNLHICFLFLLYTMLNDVYVCTSTNSSIRMQPSTKAYWISKHLHDIRKPSVDQGFQLLFQCGLAQKLTEYECTEKM